MPRESKHNKDTNAILHRKLASPAQWHQCYFTQGNHLVIAEDSCQGSRVSSEAGKKKQKWLKFGGCSG
ncbi:hypothetical protein C5167_006541, partial [Papaver somniferum]